MSTGIFPKIDNLDMTIYSKKGEKLYTIKTPNSKYNRDNNAFYLRGFGTFYSKKRSEKTGRNIKKNTTIIIPEHYVPAFKPSKKFITKVKQNIK